MSICHCTTRQTIVKCNCYTPAPPSPCSCCLSDELNLVKLKNTNHELKALIGRLDNLTTSVGSSLTHRCHPTVETCTRCYSVPTCCSTPPSPPACVCVSCTTTKSGCSECTVCSVSKVAPLPKIEWTVCDECERMLYIAKQLEKTDPTIYPTVRYPSGRHRFCSKCDRCWDDVFFKRVEVRSRSRSRSKSRHASRSSSPYLAVDGDLPKPLWNGGPYKSYYGWTEWKLKHKK